MGAVGLDSPRLGAFQSDIFPRGLDLGRSVILQDTGVWRAASAADFEAGMLVTQDADGNIVKCVSQPVFGVAKWNKTSLWKAATVDEPVSFPSADSTVSLAHPNVSNFQLRDAQQFDGSAFTGGGTDYTLNATNGTLTHNSGGSIPVGTTVWASYTYELSQEDLQFQGRNFFNFQDDVSIADNRITVITDSNMLFTTQYDTSQVYTLTGATKNLYCGGNTADLAGLFTSDSSEGEFVGHVLQVPTADDPFLGVRLGGDPVEQ